MSVSPDLHSFNPLDPSALQCPIPPEYARLRAEEPVFYVEALDLYLVTRHDLVCEVLRDTARFSSDTAKLNLPTDREEYAKVNSLIAEGYPRIPTLMSADAPAHTRYRLFVSKCFSPKVIAGYEPLIRTVTTRLIDGWIDTRRIEFLTQFAVPLPMEVTAAVLSVPADRLDDAKRWSEAANVAFGTAPSLEARLAGQRVINEFQAFFADAIEQRRRNPHDDLLTNLLNVRIDDVGDGTSRELNVPEMLSIVHSLLSGGNEMTTKLLAELLRRLAEEPERWQRVRREPSLIPAVVEEALRFASPAMGSWRVATHDVELGGVTIPQGSTVIPLFGSANRDEEIFPNPDSFEPARANLNQHVAFGKGAHYCPGAALSRLEARVALEELSRQLRDVSLPTTNEFPYDPSFLLRGLVSLELDIEPV